MKETSRRNVLSAIGVGAAAAAVGSITKTASAGIALPTPLVEGALKKPLIIPAMGTTAGKWGLLTLASGAASRETTIVGAKLAATAPLASSLGPSADGATFTIGLYNNGGGLAVYTGPSTATTTRQTAPSGRCNTDVHIGIL